MNKIRINFRYQTRPRAKRKVLVALNLNKDQSV